MAYKKQTFIDRTTVLTAEHLNHIEEGISEAHRLIAVLVGSIGGGTGGTGGAGNDGATFIPSVSANGVLSWTNDKGMANPSPIDLVNAVIAALPSYDGTVTIE